MLARKVESAVDGFVIEGPTAGGHNAPPRVKAGLNEHGEPIYGRRTSPIWQSSAASVAHSGWPARTPTRRGSDMPYPRALPASRWALPLRTAKNRACGQTSRRRSSRQVARDEHGSLPIQPLRQPAIRSSSSSWAGPWPMPRCTTNGPGCATWDTFELPTLMPTARRAGAALESQLTTTSARVAISPTRTAGAQVSVQRPHLEHRPRSNQARWVGRTDPRDLGGRRHRRGSLPPRGRIELPARMSSTTSSAASSSPEFRLALPIGELAT